MRSDPGDQPHDEDDDDDPEELEEQRDTDRQSLDGLEVAELSHADREQAVRDHERQVAPHHPPVPPQRHDDKGQQDGRRPEHAQEDDQGRRPTGLDQRLRKRSGRGKRRGGEQEGKQARAELAAHCLNHGDELPSARP